MTAAALLLALLGHLRSHSERSLRVEVTAYCLNGRTSTGQPTRPGILAVDPNTIPLGSEVSVPGFGWWTAADSCPRRGGVNVWLPSQSCCCAWGSRSLIVRVRKQK